MKRFVFRLQRILDLRAAAERTQGGELQAAHAAEDERRRALERAHDDLDRCADQISARTTEVQNAGTLRLLSLARAAAARQVDAARASHHEAVERVEAEQARFDEARRDRKAIQRLREHRREDWKLETSRDEQRQIDEAARERANEREDS